MPDAVALTDYALAAVTAVLGLALIRGGRDALPVRLWGLAFLALAAAGALAGFWHAHEHDHDAATLAWIWRVHEWGIALFGVGVVAGAARAAFSGRVLRITLMLAALVALAFVVWTWNQPQFRYVVVLDILIMATVLTIHLARLRREPATPWIVAGIATSAVAAGFQASNFSIFGLHHNAVFHLIQLAAMLLLFAGARRLRGGPSTFPPGLPK